MAGDDGLLFRDALGIGFVLRRKVKVAQMRVAFARRDFLDDLGRVARVVRLHQLPDAVGRLERGVQLHELVLRAATSVALIQSGVSGWS